MAEGDWRKAMSRKIRGDWMFWLWVFWIWVLLVSVAFHCGYTAGGDDALARIAASRPVEVER